MDTEYLTGRMMSGERKVNREALRNCPQGLYAFVTDAETGVAMPIDLRTAEDSVKVMSASICVPGVSSIPSVEIDGRNYIDGATQDPMQLDQIFGMGYTDVVVIANINPENGSNYFQNLLVAANGKKNYGYGSEVLREIRQNSKICRNAAKDLRRRIKDKNSDRRVVLITPTRDSAVVDVVDTNGPKIFRGYESALAYTKNLVSPQS
jgi:predicted acylesterase/phospholipase RssA